MDSRNGCTICLRTGEANHAAVERLWVGSFSSCSQPPAGMDWGKKPVAAGLSMGCLGRGVPGAPLQPRRGSFGGGILVGSAGDFIGRGRRDGVGMTFAASPWQYPSAGGPSPTYPASALGAIRVRPLIPQPILSSGSSPALEVGEKPVSTTPTPPASDQWLRQPTDTAE